jgi:hypothetical protein
VQAVIEAVYKSAASGRTEKVAGLA